MILSTMIHVENLTKVYGKNTVLDGINLTIADNKIYGILGRNGAGKTTLINIITNRAFATSGECTVDGMPTAENDRAQGKIFCITEKGEYPTYLRVKNAFKWAKRFYPSFDIDYANELSEKFDLDINKRFKQLSTGYRTIAKAILTLACRVPVMILDEPVLGIDAIYRKVFYGELLKLHSQEKNIIIIATHILDEIEGVAEEIIVLKKGKVIHTGATANIIKTEKSLQDFYINLHDNAFGHKEGGKK